ncbi:MAG TPA: diaminopimelate epimerase [Anaerovoracaceae bacterium]|nr:diaminopimelate epimerase [Anaerovoracaceae bacterium]
MIQFTKYHGCGNDFILLTEESVSDHSYSELAKQICHRQLGIGADGLIIVKQDPLEMIIFNSDGSRAPMCGNGLRCFAKFCSDEGICTKEVYSVETLAGTMGIHIISRDPFLVEVNMGKPDFDPKRCGIKTDQDYFFRQKLQLKNDQIEVSSCFMGTIHTVVWMDKLEGTDLEKLGEEISNHPVFSEKTNVNFVQILNRKALKLITYERGAGMTYACGTGACASVVIGLQADRCDRETNVLLPYGQLHIEQKINDEVMMTGPAVRIVQGCYEDRRE